MILEHKLMTSVCFAAAVGLVGCSETGPERLGTAPATLEAVADQLGPKGKEFKIDAREGGRLRGEAISIRIPPRAIVDRAGEPQVDTDGDGEPDAELVTGTVMIQLREMNNVGDVIRAGRSTSTADGQLLESSGSFEIAPIGRDDQKLAILELADVNFKAWPDGREPEMGMWLAKDDNGGNGEEGGGGAWVQPDQLVEAVPPAGGGGGSFFFDSMPFGSIGNWAAANCDAITSLSPNATTLRVKVPDELMAQGGVFFLPDNSNTAAKLYTKDYGLPGYVSYANSMPVGVTGKLIVIGLDAGDYYLYHDDNYTIPATNPIDLDISPPIVSQAAFDAYMNSL